MLAMVMSSLKIVVKLVCKGINPYGDNKTKNKQIV